MEYVILRNSKTGLQVQGDLDRDRALGAGEPWYARYRAEFGKVKNVADYWFGCRLMSEVPV